MPRKYMTDEQKEAKKQYDKERYLRKKAEAAAEGKPSMLNKNRPTKYNITKKRVKINDCGSCGARFVYINYNGCDKNSGTKKNHAVYGNNLNELMEKINNYGI